MNGPCLNQDFFQLLFGTVSITLPEKEKQAALNFGSVLNFEVSFCSCFFRGIVQLKRRGDFVKKNPHACTSVVLFSPGLHSVFSVLLRVLWHQAEAWTVVSGATRLLCRGNGNLLPQLSPDSAKVSDIFSVGCLTVNHIPEIMNVSG